MINIEKVSSDYPEFSGKYDSFRKELVCLLEKILKEEQIHGITSRIKQLNSLADKIARKEDKYTELDDVTDICGLRIITYLESDVDKISTIIRENFKIDVPNCVDKRKKEPNKFGYNSLHLVISLDNADYQEFKDLKAEIQIRSILQHAWAEIEHDLGYKSEDIVPYEFKRRFNRLSAILESADFEFDNLKLSKQKYADKVEETIVTKGKDIILIDQISLSVFVDSDKTLNDVREMLTRLYNVFFTQKSGPFDEILKKLDFFRIKSVNELGDQLSSNKERLLKFTNLLFERRNDNPYHLRWEAPLEYFLHFLGASKNDDYWQLYRLNNPSSSSNNIKEVVDFLQLYQDSFISD